MHDRPPVGLDTHPAALPTGPTADEEDTMPAIAGVDVRAPPLDRFEEILTPSALDDPHQRFDARRRELPQDRQGLPQGRQGRDCFGDAFDRTNRSAGWWRSCVARWGRARSSPTRPRCARTTATA
jgi:hypothetical protein